MRFQTKAIHSGLEPDPTTGALVTPIHQSATFVFEDIGVNKGFDYSRTGNPTRKALEDNLAALEGGTYAAALTTGMAAETTVASLFQSGDHIICGNDVYGGTFRLFNYLEKQFQVEFTFISLVDLDKIAAQIRPNTKALWIETPSNPLFNTVDRIVYEEPPGSDYEQQLAAERQQLARSLYEDLWRLLQFVAIHDGYVKESMRFERFMDVLCLLEMEVFKQRRIWGPRKARVKVGEPINLKDRASSYTADKRETVREVTMALESSVRDMLDALGSECEMVDDSVASP